MNTTELPEHAIAALNGNNAPVSDESVWTDLTVIGTVPADMNGLYVRNGPRTPTVPRIGATTPMTAMACCTPCSSTRAG